MAAPAVLSLEKPTYRPADHALPRKWVSRPEGAAFQTQEATLKAVPTRNEPAGRQEGAERRGNSREQDECQAWIPNQQSEFIKQNGAVEKTVLLEGQFLERGSDKKSHTGGADRPRRWFRWRRSFCLTIPEAKFSSVYRGDRRPPIQAWSSLSTGGPAEDRQRFFCEPLLATS